MGWYKVAKLNVEMGDDSCGCHLFSRGGLNGLEVHIGCQIIKLPKNIILDLVADEYIKGKISNYESMGTAEALIDMGLAVSVSPKTA